MRKITMLLATVGAMLLLVSGVALAAQIACKGGTCTGTNQKDRITGTAGRDMVNAKNGGDTVFGRASADVIRGGFGADKIYGQGGNDILHGGSGPDRLVGGPGRDTVDADQGNDSVNAADGTLDSVSCGVGTDTAIIDEVDVSRQSFEDFVRLSSCENTMVR
ncbi:MAG: hypothetical protein M3479_00895 [Actinomycetota bacterium]|jgi:Ca2+-binding RTX toxin-like protein|nr:hypothetical protein [Actinomycetota bacterium]